MEKILVIGAGGHGRSVAESILLMGRYEILGFLDDSWPKLQSVMGYPVLGAIDAPKEYTHVTKYVVAIGNNLARQQLQVKCVDMGFIAATITQPSAIISPSSSVGCGTVILAGAIIGTNSKIGQGVIINTASAIDHDVEVADFAHAGVGTVMAGGAKLSTLMTLRAGNSFGTIL